MKAFYLFFLFLFLSMNLIDTAPANGRIRSMLGFGKKAAPAPTPKVEKKPSFSSSTPNIPNAAPAGAKTFKSSHENVQKFNNQVTKTANAADVQKKKNISAGNQAGANANRRTEHYTAHNRNELLKASNSGNKIALSRSESGRHDVYHAVPRN